MIISSGLYAVAAEHETDDSTLFLSSTSRGYEWHSNYTGCNSYGSKFEAAKLIRLYLLSGRPYTVKNLRIVEIITSVKDSVIAKNIDEIEEIILELEIEKAEEYINDLKSKQKKLKNNNNQEEI